MKTLISRRIFLGRLFRCLISSFFLVNSQQILFSRPLDSKVMSKVITVYHPGASDGSKGRDNENLNSIVVKHMVDTGIMAFTGKSTLKDAWEEIIPDTEKRVAIKVNCQIEGIYTKAKVVKPITDGLILRGVNPDNIIIYDKRDTAFKYAGFSKNLEKGIKIGTVDELGGYSRLHQERLANLLTGANYLSRLEKFIKGAEKYRCDYLINVPVLKALDGYSGVTLSMKNHYGSIAYPTHNDLMIRIPRINNLPEIKDRTRLIVLDAIFAEYKWINGRDQSYVDVVNKIMISKDPVAIDYLGWRMIDEIRNRHDMPPVSPKPIYIQNAANLGLGTNKPEEIDHIEINLA